MPIIVDPSTPTSTFLELLTEFYARGYSYLAGDAAGILRAKRWINQAYEELCEEHLWPFLLTTLTGAAPLLIPDLRSVYSVTDTASDTRLRPVVEDELTDAYVSLTTTGTPTGFYCDDMTIRTYPVGGTLRVRYYAVPAELVGDADVAVVPRRFTNLIVDGAVRRAANDNDGQAAAAQAEAERQRGLERMWMSLMFRDGTRHYQRVTGASEDW